MHADELQRVEAPAAGRASRQDGSRERIRAAIFIENDIIYRHFIQSDAFDGLTRETNVTFVFAAAGPENKRLTVPIEVDKVHAPVEMLPVEPGRVFYWRRLFQVSQLVWRPGRVWKQLRKVSRYFLGRKASLIYTVFGLPGVYQLFRWATYRQIDRLPSQMDRLIERLDPDVLIHPTVFDGYFINDLILIGRRRQIPTVAIMNSWDNPSSKRSVVGRPDWVLVWGPQTQAHAARYMGIKPERALPFGVAQFDVYRRPARLSRDEFCARHGIDPAKRVLLYAGSSKGTDEFEHLRMIEAAIDSGVLTNLAVVYRPHPWGAGGYKGERLLDYPWRHVAIDTSMRDYLETVRAGGNAKYLADYRDTHDVLSSVDAVVSPLSTIVIEAALHGKPVLCFIPEQSEGSSLDLQKQLVHFDDLYDCKAMRMAHGKSALVPALVQLLPHCGDAVFSADLLAECRYFVSAFDRPFSERIVDLVQQIVHTGVGKAPPGFAPQPQSVSHQ